ncbi:guanylate cyclase domain-containing protein, partial [Haematococcus lacustris]
SAPGYLNAPHTPLAPLSTRLLTCGLPRPTYPPMTLVFCAMEKFSEMRAVNMLAAQEVYDLYGNVIRRTLLAVGGYECQEFNSAYMIAFEHAADALEWALMVQETMMEAPWTPAMLSLPGCATSLSTEQPGLLLFHGPRVKVGLYQGTPVKVVPHSTTGRADYFGPLVNRAARFCHAAAQGGQ